MHGAPAAHRLDADHKIGYRPSGPRRLLGSPGRERAQFTSHSNHGFGLVNNYPNFYPNLMGRTVMGPGTPGVYKC
jgi:hypothetical protein